MARKSLPAKRSAPAPSTSANDDTIPPPFAPASTTLVPLLNTFDKSKVYIIHIDRHPASFKRRIFAVPVLLNATIVALLCWRAYAALPTYLSLIFKILGERKKENEIIVDPKTGQTRSFGSLVQVVFLRTFMLAFDYFLYAIVWPWPVSFFAESPANPLLWRWHVGFRADEIYVRVSRGWGAEDLLPPARSSTTKAGGESPFFKVRILPAVDRTFMQKTGYLMMGKDWDLDFAAIIEATELVDKKTIALADLEKKVVVWSGNPDGSSGKWAVWDIHRLDEGAEDDSRRKIVEFRDRLVAMGKETLFFRWVEIIQYESTRPEGFSEERAASQVAELFAEHGVDFEEFARSVGGLGAMSSVQNTE